MKKFFQYFIIMIGIIILLILFMGRPMTTNSKEDMVQIPSTDYTFHVEYRWVEKHLYM
jgi:hypothetical protein